MTRDCSKCGRPFEPKKDTHIVCSRCVMRWIMSICEHCGRTPEDEEGPHAEDCPTLLAKRLVDRVFLRRPPVTLAEGMALLYEMKGWITPDFKRTYSVCCPHPKGKRGELLIEHAGKDGASAAAALERLHGRWVEAKEARK